MLASYSIQIQLKSNSKLFLKCNSGFSANMFPAATANHLHFGTVCLLRVKEVHPIKQTPQNKTVLWATIKEVGRGEKKTEMSSDTNVVRPIQWVDEIQFFFLGTALTPCGPDVSEGTLTYTCLSYTHPTQLTSPEPLEGEIGCDLPLRRYTIRKVHFSTVHSGLYWHTVYIILYQWVIHL